MWATPEGERILQGAEARLFRAALGVVVDELNPDTAGLCCTFDAPPFDELKRNQKLALLAQVATALLCEDQPIFDATAIAEAAVAAVYHAIPIMVQMEIDLDEGDSLTVRKLVLAACREQGFDDLPRAKSDDCEEWESLADCLSEAVLWDEDWRQREFLLDVDPQTSRAIKEQFGIHDDYYVGIPPDPTEEEMKGVRATLQRLTKRGS